jgi:hypothetical protein
MSTYRVVIQIANRVKEIPIEASTSLEAFKKFKELMPKIMFNNLSVKEITVDIPVPNPYIKKNEPRLCSPCEPTFNKIIKKTA